MRRLAGASEICWDWAYLCHQHPQPRHILAVQELWSLLKPCLEHTEWPSGSSHPHVVHQWPNQDELCVQYMVLCARIREAVASHGVLHDAWLSVRRCTVEPVTHCHRLQRTLVTLLHTRLRLSLRGAHSTAGRDAAAVAWVAAVVATILDFVFPCPLGGAFEVPVDGLCRIGWGRRYRSMRGNFKSSLAVTCRRDSRYASLTGPSDALRGRWVRIVGEHREPSRGAVAASLDIESALSGLCAGGRHCWHIARMHHRSRHMRGVEAACERWGSLIHSLWDDVAGLGPSRMVTRLLLKESGLLCQGAPQDEAFVREIARVLVDVEGRTTSKKRTCDGNDTSYALQHLSREGGLMDRHMDFTEVPGIRMDLRGPPAQWVRRHAPISIPPVAANAVRQGVDADRRGATVRSQLPLFGEDARTLRKDRAGSTLRARMQEFLKSSAGREWWLAREALWSTPDDHCLVVDDGD